MCARRCSRIRDAAEVGGIARDQSVREIAAAQAQLKDAEKAAKEIAERKKRELLDEQK